ncbi:diheme cytochrome c [Lusitaniella coriacea]|nr:diheme cytochrome c [Lusitaniella coriacea]
MSKFKMKDEQKFFGIGARAAKGRSRLILFFLVLVWSIIAGSGIAFAMGKSPVSRAKSVDFVPEKFQLAQELYLENCGSCHIAIPPAVFPTQTWQQILENPEEHYSVSLKPIIGPELLIMWDYIKIFSRALNEEEETPFRFLGSRYFKALHPRVDFPESVVHTTCASCHPGAREFNFRRLSPEWEDAP